MIKVYKLNKRFNKHKRNEIHVLKDITLEFPNKGLVFLLGPSGSGKSTLLNAIGGLDKVDSGEVEIDDKKMTKYRFRQWDYLRNQHIGYIFQNYILFPDLNVYDNIAFSLRMTGIDKDAISERIEYALKAVKMEKFKKRKVKNLSGGQQQRVAIARALVKSPDVIIADEPTGNLDTNNTNQIMNIIKKISQSCLVIMVTHETRLAHFYGDRIIEIKDGAIVSDYLNTESNVLTGSEDRNLYLQDLNHDSYQEDDLYINYFYQETKIPFKLNVIYKDNTFYLYTPETNVNIKFLSPGDEIKVIDGKKEPMTLERIDDINYSLEKITSKKAKHTTITLKEAIRMAFSRLLHLKWFHKFFMMSFALIAIMLVISVASLLGVFKFNDSSLVYEDRHYLTIKPKDPFTVNDTLIKEYIDLVDHHGINEFIPGSFNGIIQYNLFHQVYNNYIQLSGSIVSLEALDQDDLMVGTMPNSVEDIVVDKWIIDNLFRQGVASAGLVDYDSFIGQIYMAQGGKIGKIVGICDTDNPSIYVHKDIRLRLFTGLSYVNEEYLSKINYTDTLSPGEVLVNAKDNRFIEDGKISILGHEFTVKDTFSGLDDISYILTSSDIDYLYTINVLTKTTFYVYSTNQKATTDYFKGLDFEVYNYNEILRQDYLKQRKSQLVSQLIFTVVVLGSSLLFMYFIMRSSLFSRVYEIGVYRAIGVTRRDIYKIFICEITIITILTSFIGWLLTSVIIFKALSKITFMVHFYYPVHVGILTLLAIYGFNLLNGLLPVYMLLRRTPAQILTKYDI